MKFEKPPPSLVELFRDVLARSGGKARQMFGYPCGFEGGNMFCGVFGASVFVRLAEDERAQMLRTSGARVFEPMPGRPMREYVVVPPAFHDEAKLQPWVDRALAYARTLPPKKAKRATASANAARPKAGRKVRRGGR